MSIEWLDEEPTPEEVNDGEPVVEPASEYDNWEDDEFPGVEAPPEPEEGQNSGEEVAL